MKEIFKKKNIEMASKKPLNITLKGCLGDLTRDVLNELAVIYDIKSLEYKHNIRVIQEIEQKLTKGSFIQEVVEQILEEDKNKFGFMCDLMRKDYIEVTVMNPETYLPLRNLGLAYGYYIDDEIRLVLPQEIKSVITSRFIKNEDLKRSKLILIYLESFRNLYGLVEVEFLINIFNEQNSDLEKLSLYELLYIVKTYLNDSDISYDVQGQYIVSKELLLKENGVDDIIELRKGKKFYKPSKDIVLKYKNPMYFHKTMDHINLKSFIDRFSKDPRLGLDLVGAVCLGTNSTHMNLEYILKILKSRTIQLVEEKDIKELMNLYKKVEMNTRKWGNKGCTDKELEA